MRCWRSELAYAVWTGIGAAGTLIMGVALFGANTQPLAKIGREADLLMPGIESAADS